MIFLTVSVLISCQDNQPHSTASPLSLPEIIDFNFHIKPIISDRCFACHGPDKKARKADLRLDHKEGAFRLIDGSKQIYVVKPGDLGKSELFRRISSDDEEVQMPPPESNLTLSAYEIKLFERWIQQGAEWKTHWAFLRPEKKSLPVVSNDQWPLNEIDHFILARLETKDKNPAVEARKEKLVRRLSFDLTGLPPSPALIDSFMLDDSERAYENLVDKLLRSSSFGERLATEWLDLARYAETNGYHHDFERNMWPWRDWVIKSFNDNMPYDQFVTWQLAGDLLPDASFEQKLATAFNRNHRTTQECGSIDEEFRVTYVIDRTNTFSTAFLGLTLECAQCHDHKYDPFSQKEYYQLSAFFNQVSEQGVTKSFQGQPYPQLELPKDQIAQIQSYIDNKITTEYSEASLQDPDQEYLGNWREELDAMLQPVMIMEDLDTLRPTYVLDRGLYDRPTEEVVHGTPRSVLPFDKGLPRNRLGLAQWLFDRENPLAARVVVNRYWQMIFGTGLVKTPEDFGNQGSLPSHPDLLDWLSIYLMESNWNIKGLLKLMVSSATYRQSSLFDAEQYSFDPDNRWLARGPQSRLSAEMLRDHALRMSGLLNSKIGGPSVKPYQPSGLWEQISSGGRYQRRYMQDHGTDLYRRSLYTYWKRMQPPPSMAIFDATNRNQCIVKRQSTSTPLQALVLLNDPQFNEASRTFAEKIIREGGNSTEDRIKYAFRWATSRFPVQEEIDILQSLFTYELEEFQEFPARANNFLQIGEHTFNEDLDLVEIATFGVLANTIMNMSESFQKN